MKKLLTPIFLLFCLTAQAGTFPNNAVLDNANRTNEGPPLSSSWTTVSNGLKVVSNVIAPGSASVGVASNTYWNVSTFGPDMESYVDCSTRGGVNDEIDLYVRANTALTTGYLAAFFNGIVQVFQTPSEAVQLGGNITQVIASGDSVGMTVVGSVITIYYKASGGSWTSIGTRSDTTNDGTGSNNRIALGIYNGTDANLREDNFGGGTITAPAAPAAANVVVTLGSGGNVVITQGSGGNVTVTRA